MRSFTLAPDEVDAIDVLLDEFMSTQADADVADTAGVDLTVAAHELPRRLRSFLGSFRLAEDGGACVVSGYRVDQERIGPTPPHWRDPGRLRARREELFLTLCGSLVGEPFAWATQQDRSLVHEVLPIREHQAEQIGTGSDQVISWHTEDAFHPYRGDYVGLMCLRNPDRVPTTFACVDQLDLTAEPVKVLFEPRYYICPDNSHATVPQTDEGQWSPSEQELIDNARARLRAMAERPEATPVLFGSPLAPYVRVDPYFMPLDRLDPEARAALEWLIDQINAGLSGVALNPGDCLFVDNYRSVHGRGSFRARYDGTDRWLKRINVARDLRASRDSRLSAGSRVIF